MLRAQADWMDIAALKREVDRCRDLESKERFAEDANWYGERASRLERTMIRLEEIAVANSAPAKRG